MLRAKAGVRAHIALVSLSDRCSLKSIISKKPQAMQSPQKRRQLKSNTQSFDFAAILCIFDSVFF